MVTGELPSRLLVSSQLAGLALLRLGIPLEATMDRRYGPTSIQLADKGATMEVPRIIMLLFLGGTVLLLGKAGGKTAGIDISGRHCGRRVCLYIENAHGLMFMLAIGCDSPGHGHRGCPPRPNMLLQFAR